MNWKRTLFFLVILGGIVGFYYFKVRQERPADRSFSFSTESTKTYILSLSDKDFVNHLTIRDTSKKTEISFLKVGEHNWQITRPIDYPAESVFIDGFVSSLKLSPRLRQFPYDETSAKEFGFDSPQIQFALPQKSSRPSDAF